MSIKLFASSGMSRSLALASACLALGACLGTPGPQVAGSGLCDDSGLGWAIGQPLDEATARRLSRESGAGLVNPIGPVTIVKRDSRSDRLRVYVDAEDRITAARCE